MAKRKKRRGSARDAPSGAPAQPRRAAPARPARAERSGPRELGAYGERPQAPWHPWPLSELLIFVGALAIAIGMIRGPERNLTTIVVGIGAVLIGTLEVSVREHFSGYRSHTMLLAVVPVVVLHSAVVIGLAGGLATMAGDLWESILKRRYGVKDSGDIIPGHGGLLDRVDGLLFAILAVAAARFIHQIGWAN